MAGTYQVVPPEPFNFAKPEEWTKWIRQFERFRVASGLDTKEEPAQVNMLIYSMGDQADDILKSFHLSEAEGKQYATVKMKFDNHFVKRRNIIYERARFNRRKQEEGETVDAFITSLYTLAEHCKYDALHDEMIRDRIVVGISNATLSEKLQLDHELTLEKAITAARQSETVHKQQPVVRGEGEKDLPVGAVQQKKTVQKGKTSYKPRQPDRATQFTPTCYKCGRSPPHDRRYCPAKEATCLNCGKKGHFQAVCRVPAKVGRIGQSDSEEDDTDVFLGAITGNTRNPWEITLEVNTKPVVFHIDTGAEVTVISDLDHSKIGSPQLLPANRTLRGPSDRALPVKGKFVAKLARGDQEIKQEIYVVKHLHRPLLGRPAIEGLQVVSSSVGGIQRKNLDPLKAYPNLFSGLGKLEGEYKIKLQEGAKPYALNTPRRVALPLMKPVKKELERMEQLGVIAKIDEPTDWCAGMVVVPKSGGKVRICIDLTKLNQSVCRERHILPGVEQTLAKLAGAKVFSKLDANSGFWQIPLSEESAKLTTFITPYGRYCFHRLPFGITSGPEHFQRRMSEILEGQEGVVCMIDDILVFGNSVEEHEEHLVKVLERLQKSGITLNKEKCHFATNRVSFLGQVVDHTGVHPDPAKVKAIQKVPVPKNVGDVRRFLGMINQMSKFTPNIADKTKPLRELLSKRTQWTWGEPQRKSFEEVKELLTSSPVLALYDTNAATVVSADASSFGLGAVLLQKQVDDEWKPIAYISRSMTPTEQRYAQIEKEALAFTWACEWFSSYLTGLQFHIHTDHKPLVPLFSTKHLEELPIRVQRFRLRMMRFTFTISHVPGKDLIIADSLSRAPVDEPVEADMMLEEETRAFIDVVMRSLPETDQLLEKIKQHQGSDQTCLELLEYCRSSWPEKGSLIGPIKKYHSVASEISIVNDLLMRGNRIIIPTSLREEMLDKIHLGHQGINKCRERARQSLWWPGLSKEIEELIKNCSECSKAQLQRAQPMIPSVLPDLPWQKIATDLFEWKGSNYLLIVDYFSRYIEIAKLSGLSADEVIKHTKSIFARHGIPDTVVSDNGPQYASEAYRDFSKSYQFQHITSSPYYPRSNGEAERAVGVVKSLLKKEGDPYMALLIYRATPTQVGFSPAELLMSRKIRTTLPVISEQRKPKVVEETVLRDRDRKNKERQKRNFDKHHGVRELPELESGETVWIKDRKSEGQVEEPVAPHSYEVTSTGATLRRNRKDLIRMPKARDTTQTVTPEPTTTQTVTPEPTTTQTVTPEPTASGKQPLRRSSRVTQPPDHWNPCST